MNSNDYADLRQEAQLAALHNAKVVLDPLLVLRLVDDLVEEQEAVEDALEALYNPVGDDFEEILGGVIGILEGV